MKTPHALVIDDHENILADIRARLDSKGHTYVTAKSQDEAEGIIDSPDAEFDYILLDVQIPCRFQSPPRLQFGKNLLVKIRQKTGFEKTPVIVITAYGNDSPHLAVEMLKLGANDFINKPFDEEKVPLEQKIDDVLRASEHQTHAKSAARAPFPGGKLIFFSDRVELLVGKKEIQVCGDRSDATIRSILDLLRQKRETKDKKTYTGKFIGQELHLPRGDAHVREAVRDFRELCTKRLFEAGFVCAQNDIIKNADRGYEFGEKIEVCTGSDDSAEIGVELSERQKAIVRALNHRGQLTRKKIADKVSFSVEAIKDDLTRLVDQKILSQDGNGSAATYSMNGGVCR
jgi:DNA-binding response OmpR family regulator